jgi:hypothetical protein
MHVYLGLTDSKVNVLEWHVLKPSLISSALTTLPLTTLLNHIQGLPSQKTAVEGPIFWSQSLYNLPITQGAFPKESNKNNQSQPTAQSQSYPHFLLHSSLHF